MNIAVSKQEPLTSSTTTPLFTRVMLWLASLWSLLMMVIHHWQPDRLAALIVIPIWTSVIGILALLFISRREYRTWTWKSALVLMSIHALWQMPELRSLARIPMASSLSDRTGEIRFVTQNCAIGRIGTFSTMQELDPDLIFLQESPGFEALQVFASKMYGDEAAVIWGPDTSIIARGELELVSELSEARYVVARWTRPTGEELIVSSLRLSPPAFRLDYWNPGCWRAHVATNDRHRQELALLVQQLPTLVEQQPVIIGGDFNTPASYRLLDPLRGTLTDTFAEVGSGWGNTITARLPFHRIDGIWVSHQATPIRSEVVNSKQSDHCMVVSDVQLH